MLAAGLPGIFSFDKSKSKECPTVLRVRKKRSHNLFTVSSTSVVQTSDADVATLVSVVHCVDH